MPRTQDCDASMEPSQNPERKYDLEERLVRYAAMIIRLVEELPKTRAGNHVAGQLLRAGTLPLPRQAT